MYYLQSQERARLDAAAQAAGQAAQLAAANAVAQAAASSVSAVASISEASLMGNYSELAVDVGAIRDRHDFDIPGRFGTVLSIVVRLTVEELEIAPVPHGEGYFFWSLEDSLDGENWMRLTGPGETGWRIMNHPLHTAMRHTLPFADRLRFHAEFRASARLDSTASHGTANGVTVRLGVLTV